MTTSTRGLKTGDLVLVPASYAVHGREKRTAVVESVSLNGLWFSDTNGTRHYAGDAEVVPVGDSAPRAGDAG